MPSIDCMETNCEWTTGQQAQDYGTTLLEDDAVVLRESEPEDFEVLAPWWNDPRWAVLQQRVIKPRPSQHLADMFASWCVNRPESGEAGFSIFEKATGALVGHVTLYGGTLPHRAADLSIMIGPEYVDKGLGTRAVKLMCSYGFKALGLHPVSLRVASYNPGPSEPGKRLVSISRAVNGIRISMTSSSWESWTAATSPADTVFLAGCTVRRCTDRLPASNRSCPWLHKDICSLT